ncbi:unnamed protein product [Cylicostephanus goldi]|uniref:7TM GPCR serpentine receptor class x (Srx) domain-containing protein n=1 Tax=Cylicostephanus goldi TaxID=71465 RepID=A0A3P7MFR3_CYLGO|nr:unnamed protein product [Cylicostephanus goldi]
MYASIFGLLANSAAILCVYRNPVLRNGFGLLCFSHSMANLGVMLVFLLWVTPMTILYRKNLWPNKHFVLECLCLFTPSDFFQSLSGLDFTPSGKRSIRYQKYAMCISLNPKVAREGFVFAGSECYIHYDATKWVFKFADTLCGSIISTYTDNYTSTTIMVVICMLDCNTLIKLRKSNNTLGTQKGNVSNYIQKKRRQNEIRFFTQTLYQNGLFLYELVSFYYVSALFTNKWAVFITATLSWEMCHAFDG